MKNFNIKDVVITVVVILVSVFMLNSFLASSSQSVQASVRTTKSVRKHRVRSHVKQPKKSLFTVNVDIGGHAVLHIVPSFRVDSIIETKNGGNFKVYQVATKADQTWYRVGKKRWIPSRDTDKPMKDGKVFAVQVHTYRDAPNKVFRTFDGFTYVYQLDNGRQRYAVTSIFG